MELSAQEVSEWIKGRKSTFVNGLKEGSKIDDSVVEQLLENASWAPSHGLVQAWYFKVFAGGGVKTFFNTQQKIYKLITPPDKFFDFKYNAYNDKWKRVSHVVAIIAKRDPFKRFPKQEDLASVACAAENIYLSLKAFGVAGYISTGETCYSQHMRDFLKLGEEDEPIGFFILGETAESVAGPTRTRVPASEKTEWIRE
jgi:nitroreductase